MSPVRYTVVTTDAANDELLTLWLNFPGLRATITRASHEIETALRHDADQQGVPVSSGSLPSRRYINRPPLRAYFEVSEADLRAEISRFLLLPSFP